jgi:hypothetical protein
LSLLETCLHTEGLRRLAFEVKVDLTRVGGHIWAMQPGVGVVGAPGGWRDWGAVARNVVGRADQALLIAIVMAALVVCGR